MAKNYAALARSVIGCWRDYRRAAADLGTLRPLGLPPSRSEDFIRSMKPRFVKRGARPLLLTTLIDPRHMLVFGPNSLFQEILDEYCPRSWFPLARHLGAVLIKNFLEQAVWTEDQHMARIDKRRQQ